MHLKYLWSVFWSIGNTGVGHAALQVSTIYQQRYPRAIWMADLQAPLIMKAL
jgi:hypothetical protein